MIRAWWIEFRNGAPLAAGLLSFAVSVLLASTVGDQPMLPGCADPLNVGLILGVTVTPVGLGVAAIHVAMLERGGMLRLAGGSSVGRSGALRLAWAAIAAWQVLAYVGGQLFIFARSDLDGHCSPQMAVLPLAGVAFSVLMSGLGILLGAAVPHWGIGLLGAVGSLIVVMGMQMFTPDIFFARFVPTFTYTYYQPFFDPNVALNLAHFALYLAGVALVWVRLLSNARGRVVGTVMATLALVVGIGLVSVVNPDPLQYRTPQERVCDSKGGIELCVWPESKAALEPGLTALGNTRAAVGDRFPTPALFLQEGLSDERDYSTFRFDMAATDADSMQEAANTAMVPQPECDAGVEEWSEINGWVRAAMGSQFVSEEELAIRDLSEAEQRSWLSERYVAATTGCSGE